MSGVPDLDRRAPRPFLILNDGTGGFTLTIRETRFNSQNYPVVTATAVTERFTSTAAARDYAKRHFGAAAGEFEVPARPVKATIGMGRKR